jgi:hypothetical protein
MTKQLRFRRPRARRTDPETSHEAADSLHHLRTSQAAVLRVLRQGSMTDQTLVREYNRAFANDPFKFPLQSESGIRTRRKELVELGMVEDAGVRIRLASGRRGIVWMAKK